MNAKFNGEERLFSSQPQTNNALIKRGSGQQVYQSPIKKDLTTTTTPGLMESRRFTQKLTPNNYQSSLGGAGGVIASSGGGGSALGLARFNNNLKPPAAGPIVPFVSEDQKAEPKGKEYLLSTSGLYTNFVRYQGQNSPSMYTGTTANGKEHKLALASAQPTDDYFSKGSQNNTVTSPIVGGGAMQRENSQQFKTMLNPHHSSVGGFKSSDFGEMQYDSENGANLQVKNNVGSYFSQMSSLGSSNMNSVVQVKFPNIKNVAKDSSPSKQQRVSQEREMVLSESDKRIATSENHVIKAQTDPQALAYSESLSLKKAINMTKKVINGSIQHNLTEDMIMRNARFFSSANNNASFGGAPGPSTAGANNLNAILFGQIENQNGVLSINGQRHDIVMAEAKERKAAMRQSQYNSGKGGITVKKQYNHQFSNMKTRQHGQHKTTPGNTFAMTNHQEDLQTGPPLVLVNKIATPMNLQQPKPIVNRIPSNMRLDKPKAYGILSNQDSQKNVENDGVASPPSKVGQYPNQTPAPYQIISQSERNQIQVGTVQDYLSPKLLYKKRKRDNYPLHGKNQISMNTPMGQVSIGKNHFLIQKDSPQKGGANVASLHGLVNQLLSKNADTQNQGFMQALKNLQSTVSKDPQSVGEAIEALNRAMSGEKYYLPSLGRSLSQEILNPTESGGQVIKDSSSTDLDVLHMSVLDQQHIQQQHQAIINFKSLHGANTKEGRPLNANEMYELAKQIKYRQYQAQQQQQQQQSSRGGGKFLVTSPLQVSNMEEKQQMLLDALNVVKMQHKQIHQRGGGGVDPMNNSYEKSLDNANFESQKSMQYRDDDAYFRNSLENSPPVVGSFHRDTSRNGHYRNKQESSKFNIKDEENMLIQGVSSGVIAQDQKMIKMLHQSLESAGQAQALKSPHKYHNLHSATLPSNSLQLHQMDHRSPQPRDENDVNRQYALAMSFPMTIIGEAVMHQQQAVQIQQNIQAPDNQNSNYYIKEFIKNRNQRKSSKQQQLAKISKISDLEKLLYSQPGFEETPVINVNPGGGGRVAVKIGNAPNEKTNGGTLKKRLEPQINDNDNESLADHPINKTIKMMNILNSLLFKGLKDFNTVQQEILNRCTRYFQFSIPKQFRHEMQTLLKQKDFLSLVRERMYTTFNNNLLKANGVTEQEISENQALGTYKYFIGGGNNHMLVKQVFKQRTWWNQSEKENFEECNFVWTQWLKERHIKSLLPYGKNQIQEANCQDPMEQESNMQQGIKIYNKIENNECLSDKKNLFFNMRDLYKSEGKDLFNVMPITFVINDGLNDIEFDRFEAVFKGIEEQIKKYPQLQAQYESSLSAATGEEIKEGEQQQLDPPKLLNNVWIIKPGEDTNRGSGIIVTKEFNEIRNIVRDKSSRQNKTAILQKYIENPLLINKRKFDIRCYGLMTSINGHMLGFFYQDGYLRTSCKEFSVQNLSNRYIHLTNDAIQKFSEDYGKFENANKLSYQDFDRYFAEFPIGDYDLRFQRDFLPQIRAMVRDTYRAAEKKIDPQRRTNTFEIFGYDFMIDDDLKLKLIEVNTNPSLEVCCPLLARIIPSMLDSVFRIAIDPVFQQPPSRRQWSGTEAVNDLKMELIFESGTPEQGVKSTTSQLGKTQASIKHDDSVQKL